jgi:hypothetical protein
MAEKRANDAEESKPSFLHVFLNPQGDRIRVSDCDPSEMYCLPEPYDGKLVCGQIQPLPSKVRFKFTADNGWDYSLTDNDEGVILLDQAVGILSKYAEDYGFHAIIHDFAPPHLAIKCGKCCGTMQPGQLRLLSDGKPFHLICLANSLDGEVISQGRLYKKIKEAAPVNLLRIPTLHCSSHFLFSR